MSYSNYSNDVDKFLVSIEYGKDSDSPLQLSADVKAQSPTINPLPTPSIIGPRSTLESDGPDSVPSEYLRELSSPEPLESDGPLSVPSELLREVSLLVPLESDGPSSVPPELLPEVSLLVPPESEGPSSVPPELLPEVISPEPLESDGPSSVPSELLQEVILPEPSQSNGPPPVPAEPLQDVYSSVPSEQDLSGWFDRAGGKEEAWRVARALWPAEDPANFKIKSIHGGSYNYVASIQIRNEKYVLRVPKEVYNITEPYDITEDIAPLLFLKNHTNIRAADIFTFRITTDSPIGRPFMIQERVKGVCLVKVYHEYSHRNRRRVAYDLGELYSQLLSVKNPQPGRVVIPPGSTDLSPRMATFPELYPSPWNDRKVYMTRPYSGRAPPEPIREFLTRVLSVQRRTWVRKNPHDYRSLETFSKYTVMVNEMDHRGFFDNVGYSFCHLDLFERNIMCNLKANRDETALTGLDWDSALFVPSFMMCTPPSWLWGRYVHVEGVNPNPGPRDAEGQELQELFEQLAGQEYMRFAYDPVYRLARRMCRELLITGIGTTFSNKRRDCLETLDAWQQCLRTLEGGSQI